MTRIKTLTLPSKYGNCDFFIERLEDGRYYFCFDSCNGLFKKKDIVKLIKFIQDELKEV